VGEPPTPDTHLTFERLTRNPRPEVDFSGCEVLHHLSTEMLSHFPRAASDASMILDLGCGDGLHRPVCEKAGFQWVGIDIESAGSPILADAHCLPFANDSFDAILSAAVLEHIQYPFVMLEEARRVLKPDGRFIGTVAFLEPYHDSFYHFSHLAVWNSLKHAGFVVDAIAPIAEWPVLRAQAEMSLFPKMPTPLAWSMVRPLHASHRLWWRLGRLLNPKATEATRMRNTAGSFIFIARA
jgi:SAM-dependent methyltransferase